MLRNLFSRRGKLADKPIEEMSVNEVFRYVEALNKAMPARRATALCRRLFWIAFYDHHVSSADRKKAFAFSQILGDSIEESLGDQPEALKAFREARSYEKENVDRLGVGSLAWLIEEQEIPAHEVARFMMRPEHGHLLKDALDALGPQEAAKLKPELVKAAIANRLFWAMSVANGVLVFHSLALMRDPATEALFDNAELEALRNTPSDYAAARNVFVRVGLLPPDSRARSLQPTPPPAHLATLLLFLLSDIWKGEGDAQETLDYLAKAGEEWSAGFRLARLAMCTHLSLATVGDAYSPPVRDEVRSALFANWPDIRETLEKQVGWLETLEGHSFEEPLWVPDVWFLDAVTRGGCCKQTEEEFEAVKDIWLEGGRLLSQKRAEYLAKLRLFLRQLAAASEKPGPNAPLEDMLSRGGSLMKEALASGENWVEEDWML